MKNINFESIGRAVKTVGKGVGLAAVLALLTKSWELDVAIDNSTKVDSLNGYSEVVKTIMDSTMFGSEKEKAIRTVKRVAGSDYYRAIIHIVESDMFGSQKVKLIEDLSK